MNEQEAAKVLREAGNWIIGVSDQSTGGYWPVVMLDTEGLASEQLGRVREALRTYSGASDVRENYLSNPLKGGKNTIGLEGAVGLDGLNDVMKLTEGPLKGQTFEWNDDKRAWVNSNNHEQEYTHRPPTSAPKDHTAESPKVVEPQAPSASPPVQDAAATGSGKHVGPSKATSADTSEQRVRIAPKEAQALRDTAGVQAPSQPAPPTPPQKAPESFDPDKRVNIKPAEAQALRESVGQHRAAAPKADVPAKASATAASVSKTAGRAQAAATAAKDVAAGDYGKAGAEGATAVTLEAAQSNKAAEAAGKVGTVAVEVAEKSGGWLGKLAGAAKLVGKRIPGVGAIVTGGFVVSQVASHAMDGEYKRAGAELVAGAAETAGNIVGFGLGDAAREAVRGGINAAGGPEVEKSGLRQLGEGVVDVAKSHISPSRSFNAQAQKPDDMKVAAMPTVQPQRRPAVTTPGMA